MREADSIDRYLLREMNENDLQGFEDRIAADDDLFFAVADRENELVDLYVRGRLDDAVAARVEASLHLVPARRAKLANAGVLRRFVEAERKADVPDRAAEERVPWYRRLGFAFAAPAYAAAALGLVLFGVAGLLIVQNRGLQGELADARDSSKAMQELQRREDELQQALDEQRSVSGDLTTDLETERERRAELEAELRRVRGELLDLQTRPVTPTIASIVLRPVTPRGGGTRTVRLADEKRASLVVHLPAGVTVDGKVAIYLNGRSIASNISVGTAKTANVAFATSLLKDGANRVSVVDAAGRELVTYEFVKVEKGNEK